MNDVIVLSDDQRHLKTIGHISYFLHGVVAIGAVLPGVQGSVLLLLMVELLNSAIEATVDRVSTERHPLSGRAKDLGSAAVMLAVILMVATWALIAGPVVWKLF